MNLLPARTCIMSAIGAAMLTVTHPASAAEWIVNANGNWDDPVNWSGSVVPDAEGVVADFSAIDITSSRTVTLENPRTAGSLKFGDLAGASNWTLTTNAAGSPLTLASGAATPVIDVANNAATIRSPLAGANGLVKSGAGTLILQGAANTYAGATVVSDGILNLGKAASILSVPGDLVIEGPGAVLISGGSNQISEAAVVTIKPGGTLNINNRPAVIAQLVLDGGVITNNTGSPAIVAQDGFDLRSGEVHSVLAGAGKTVVKSTPGTVVLTANNTYSGGTLVQQGTLQVGDGGTAGTLGASGTAVTNHGRVVFNRGAGSALTASGVISGTGSVVKTGPGTVALSAQNDYSGGTILSNGTVNVSSSSTLGDGPIEFAGGVLNVTANRSASTAPLNNAIVMSGDGAITTTSSSGTVDLNLAGPFSGPAGVLTFRNDGANDATDVFDPRLSGGDFAFTRPIVIDNGAVGATRLNSFNSAGTTQTFAGPITGNGSFRKSASSGAGGTTIFSGMNSYSGPTLVNAGELRVNGGLGTNSVTVNGGATLSGAGVILGPVSIQTGATLSPGDGLGALTISNALALGAGGRVVMEINAADPSSDQVAGLSSVSYDGTLELIVAGSLKGGEAFTLFKAAAYSGAFAAVSPQTPGVGLKWNMERLAVDGVLLVESTNVVTQPLITRCAQLTDRAVQLTLSGAAGQPYSVWASTNLALPYGSWTVLTNSQFESATCTFNDSTAANQPRRFYRITTP